MLTTMRRRWHQFVEAVREDDEDYDDPRAVVEWEIDEARRQHELLTEQVTTILRGQRELEISLYRELDEVEKLKAAAALALRAAHQARAGDAARAAENDALALNFANRLVALEDSAANLRELLDKAAAASSAARQGVEQNSKRVKETLTGRTKSLSRLEGARLQERLSAALRASADSGDASLADVRERIEARYERAIGAADVVSADPAALETQRRVVNDRARNRLTRIRSDIGLTDLPPVSVPVPPQEQPRPQPESMPLFQPRPTSAPDVWPQSPPPQPDEDLG